MRYEFDRYRRRVKMAQGAVVEADTRDEAVKKARALFAADAQPGEMAETEFVLRNTELD